MDTRVKEATDRFRQKLTNKGFTMSQSKNHARDYTEQDEEADTQAIIDFSETDAFDHIRKMK
ncbi:MAG: hypothetical protein FWH50_02220 [Coriobacteriia bacterium]|nr:hypothetical protein [Coriobacteriia bacterium]